MAKRTNTFSQSMLLIKYNQTDVDKLNFGDKIRDLKNLLHEWQKRRLMLYKKINIVKILGLSKQIFNVSVLHIPNHYMEQVNKITFKFIWDKNSPKIKRKTIMGDKKKEWQTKHV